MRAVCHNNEKESPMKGDTQAIAHLQAQLKNELTAINQYFVHYRMLKHWGLDKLAKKEYEESIGEMKHADKLMDRIFTLDGLPNLQDLGKLNIGENVPEILRSDLALETGAQATIKDGIAHCEKVRDRGTPRLPRDPDRADREGGPAELPAEPDGRSLLTRSAPCAKTKGLRSA
jgi:bacterioferritin